MRKSIAAKAPRKPQRNESLRKLRSWKESSCPCKCQNAGRERGSKIAAKEIWELKGKPREFLTLLALLTWAVKITQRIGTKPPVLQCSAFNSSFFKDVLQSCFVFDIVNFEYFFQERISLFCSCELPRFWGGLTELLLDLPTSTLKGSLSYYLPLR